MPQTLIALDPSITAIERPSCPKCHGPMFTGIASGPADYDSRTFECVMCPYIEKIAVETNMMGWINSSGLRRPT
jgi:hypothetical protein